MRQWLDAERDGVRVLLEPRDFDAAFGLRATLEEVDRHAKPISVPYAEIRESRFGVIQAYRALQEHIDSRAWWQAWAIRCERALARPEPGWDANGAPV